MKNDEATCSECLEDENTFDLDETVERFQEMDDPIDHFLVSKVDELWQKARACASCDDPVVGNV